jgi:hypothetical protein
MGVKLGFGLTLREEFGLRMFELDLEAEKNILT